MVTIASRPSDLPSHPRAPYYWTGDGGGSGASGQPKRRLTNVVTGAVSPSGVAEGEVQFNKASGNILLSVQSETPAWIRLYATAADRAADAGRLVDDPIPDGVQGLILDVLFEAGGPTEYQINAAGELGALAFNSDDPAEAVLYYRVVVTDPTSLGLLFEQTTFAVTPSDTGNEGRWNGGVWSEAKSLRWRYYEAFGQMRAWGSTDVIGVFANAPSNPSSVSASINLWRSNSGLDVSDMSAYICAYLRPDFGTELGSEVRRHLRLGLFRTDASTVTLDVFWKNDAGSPTTLGQLVGFPMAFGDSFTLKVVLTPNGSGATYSLLIDDVEKLSGDVPIELLTDDRHRYIGITATGSPPAEAPLGFGSVAIQSILVEEDGKPTVFGLGHLPVEDAGGSLTNPPDSTVVP